MIELVEAIQKIAVPGHTEEDLKMIMEPKLQEFLRKRKIDQTIASPRYEVHTHFAGRRDAVYGDFTLEYKRPGYLSNQRNLENAAQQLARYLEASVDQDEGVDVLKRVAGACTDGLCIFFMRYWSKELLYARQYPRRQLSLFGGDTTLGGFRILGP